MLSKNKLSDTASNNAAGKEGRARYPIRKKANTSNLDVYMKAMKTHGEG